ncbi:DUF2326 domain-containing protein [Methylobacterium sp. WL69]|uniref:DUF2326 domain-containing protein n=1 Tax=Methylobacterium sp. WL69 TaxID=2603893 RepID=UPI0011C86D16|nr:DUF2326 domain-containing protein [Methylobacterium sp. WL69]TXM73464.1 DUF2326 domain-containing protein [Methylobacterium sp. WL69]
MITKIWSDLPTFREVEFGVAMNVVLADTNADSEETESTNGLGKTTLLRIIHFCLGSDFAKERTLSHPDLYDTTFSLACNERDIYFEVHRNTARPKIVSVTWHFVADLSLEFERDGDLAIMSVEEWRYALSARLVPEARLPDEPMKFNPSFRSLSYYLIRLGKEAFAEPQTAFKNQSGLSRRIDTSFLLSLNWPIQRQLHALQETRASVNAALRAVANAAEADNENSIGDLEADRVLLEEALAKREKEVSEFNLREDYHELETRLQAVDTKIHELLNDNHADGRLLTYYQESAQETPLFDANEPVEILRDAGALFRPEALRSLKEVADFHRQIYANRKQFLAAEITRLNDRIKIRNAGIAHESAVKSAILKTLSSSGALDALIALQRGASELTLKLEALKARIEDRKRFDRRKDELTRDISQARTLLKQDLDDRRATIDEAIVLFGDYTRFLYGVPGKLGVDVNREGYQFSFAIDRMGSDGVDQMVVFCFDLVVATLRARRGGSFLSLVHDSSMFADVDPRQYGLALQLACRVSEAEKFQYVCCLNVGALPRDHLGDLDLEPYIKLRLSDDGDAGRLLGKRLRPRES